MYNSMAWVAIPMKDSWSLCERDAPHPRCPLQGGQRAVDGSRLRASWGQAGWGASMRQDRLSTPIPLFRLCMASPLPDSQPAQGKVGKSQEAQGYGKRASETQDHILILSRPGGGLSHGLQLWRGHKVGRAELPPEEQHPLCVIRIPVSPALCTDPAIEAQSSEVTCPGSHSL